MVQVTVPKFFYFDEISKIKKDVDVIGLMGQNQGFWDIDIRH